MDLIKSQMNVLLSLEALEEDEESEFDDDVEEDFVRKELFGNEAPVEEKKLEQQLAKGEKEKGVCFPVS